MSERWEVENWGQKFAVFSRDGNGYLVCTLDKDNSAKQEANATLIAAAPDLLAALENAPDFGGKPSTAFGRQYRGWQEEVATAIAAVKQEGE